MYVIFTFVAVKDLDGAWARGMGSAAVQVIIPRGRLQLQASYGRGWRHLVFYTGNNQPEVC